MIKRNQQGERATFSKFTIQKGLRNIFIALCILKNKLIKMERESNPMQTRCSSGCGFCGNPAQGGLCSVCFKVNFIG